MLLLLLLLSMWHHSADREAATCCITVECIFVFCACLFLIWTAACHCHRLRDCLLYLTFSLSFLMGLLLLLFFFFYFELPLQLHATNLLAWFTSVLHVLLVPVMKSKVFKLFCCLFYSYNSRKNGKLPIAVVHHYINNCRARACQSLPIATFVRHSTLCPQIILSM